MNIIITGSRGRVGKYVTEYVQAQGTTVFGVDVAPSRWDENYIQADLTDFGQTVDALQTEDPANTAVIHLAAVADSRLINTSKTFGGNMQSTWNVLEASRMLGIKRVVFASSIQALYSSTRKNKTSFQYFPVDESHPLDPQSDYALSKALGEQVADMFAKHYGMTTISLRFMWVCMPEDFANMPFPDYDGDVHALYAYCTAPDTARACYLAATAPLPPSTHEAFFIAAQDTWVNVPSSDLAKRIDPNADVRGLLGNQSLVSSEKAKRLLGFEAAQHCHFSHVPT